MGKYSNLNSLEYLTFHFFTSSTPLSYSKNKLITFDSFINNLNDFNKMIISTKDYKPSLDKLNINKERWYLLYKSNDKINNYINTLNYKKIVLFGKRTEIVINYFKLYNPCIEIKVCNTVDDLIKYSNQSVLIIDTDSEIYKLKEKIYNNQLLLHKLPSKIMSLNELCKYSEYLYFINKIYKNKDLSVFVYNYPSIEEYENLTDDEKIRIAFDHHYRYYYDRYKTNKTIDKLLKKVFKKLYSDEFILSRNYLPNVYLKNGRCYLEDSDNKYCVSVNGCRRTLYQDSNNNLEINVFGPCVVFGALVDDRNTISTILQEKINKHNFDYNINNYGARTIDFSENIRITDDLLLKKNDVLIYIISKEESEILKKLNFNKVKSLSLVFNNKKLKNYFIDEPIHCNHIANKFIADYIYEDIKSKLIKKGTINKPIPLNRQNQNKVFENNPLIKEYINYLSTFPKTKGKSGCIVMNCNPFTYGHYNLIKYAASTVERLFVIVVKEDKSYFKFKDRFKMVELGCKDFPNVSVLHSGNIFVSAMTFPEYFNKEEKQDICIDVSLDREIFVEYIVPTLNIGVRFLGEEKHDIVTNYLNEDLKKYLPLFGVKVEIIPRFKNETGNVISAKLVRKSLFEKDYEMLKTLVPKTTYDYLIKKYNR